MLILLWLLPAIIVTGLAMVYAAVAGRDRNPSTDEAKAAAEERFAEAIMREVPHAGVTGVRRQSESTVVPRRRESA